MLGRIGRLHNWLGIVLGTTLQRPTISDGLTVMAARVLTEHYYEE